jgi:hypothetical protein
MMHAHLEVARGGQGGGDAGDDRRPISEQSEERIVCLLWQACLQASHRLERRISSPAVSSDLGFCRSAQR